MDNSDNSTPLKSLHLEQNDWTPSKKVDKDEINHEKTVPRNIIGS